MSSFTARLHLPGQTKLPVGVEVDIAEERMTLTSGDQPVGEWTLTELEVVSESDGFHITANSEEMILNVEEPDRFAIELGVTSEEATPHPNGNGPSIGLHSPILARLRFEDLETRIGEVDQALASNHVEPAEAFTKWLSLLKELNRRHGQGSMPSRDFYELNSRLLDLFPTPN